MAAFTARKQGIHDIIAKTIVLDTRWNEYGFLGVAEEADNTVPSVEPPAELKE